MAKIFEMSLDHSLIANSAFNNGGKVYTYEAGTTTPLATYTDNALSVAHANPVILNSRGMPQNSSGDYTPIYLLDDDYKFVIKDSNDNTLFTVDDYSGSTPTASSTTSLPANFTSGDPVPTESMSLGVLVCERSLTLPAGATNSYARSRAAATAETIFTITKNGSSIGTVTFAAAGTSGTFSVASETSFVAGDRVEITAPAVADDTIRYIGIVLRFTVV